ncbi:MAG: carbon-phosphorus lyase complex subunit PhnI [Desulfosarcina sp.]|nr:carbon-phosphorus lyase complex subunit PhnI [Desulfobacterales bacterium]
MYVAVKGGEKAIANAHRLLDETRRGDPVFQELDTGQLVAQLGLAVDRVMTEGSLYDPELGALAIKQAQGDLIEAVFLLRAFRTTLPRFGATCPVDTGKMEIRRRVSATFKDLPGGQILGSTYDYTHRLLDFSLLPKRAAAESMPPAVADHPVRFDMPRLADILSAESLIEQVEPEPHCPSPPDLTRDPLELPADRAVRLQNLARGDEGFLLSMAYSYQRGFGAKEHPFVGEIRIGEVEVAFVPEELGFPVVIGAVTLTECVMISRHVGDRQTPPKFVQGYGLTFGNCERKSMSMSMVDRALRCRELNENEDYPVQNQEFMLYHSDSVEASGFVQHLKLPHYVDFQADLVQVRRMRAEFENQQVPETEVS